MFNGYPPAPTFVASPGQHKYLATRKEADDFQIGSRITVLADDAFPVKPGSMQEFPNMLLGGPFE